MFVIQKSKNQQMPLRNIFEKIFQIFRVAPSLNSGDEKFSCVLTVF